MLEHFLLYFCCPAQAILELFHEIVLTATDLRTSSWPYVLSHFWKFATKSQQSFVKCLLLGFGPRSSFNFDVCFLGPLTCAYADFTLSRRCFRCSFRVSFSLSSPWRDLRTWRGLHPGRRPLELELGQRFCDTWDYIASLLGWLLGYPHDAWGSRREGRSLEDEWLCLPARLSTVLEHGYALGWWSPDRGFLIIDRLLGQITQKLFQTQKWV